MKWLIAATLTGSTALVPAAIDMEGTGSGTPTVTHVATPQDILSLPVDPVLLAKELRLQDLHEKNFVITERNARISEERSNKINVVLDKLKGYVGKTPYVFSGASPRGWDCSGLVMWTYKQLGISVPHSASAQLSAGKHVKHPLPGDIVVWGGGYHSGIYLGHGRVLNALNPYRDTNIIDVEYLYGKVTYVRAF